MYMYMPFYGSPSGRARHRAPHQRAAATDRGEDLFFFLQPWLAFW